jgi:peptidyl-prolyl cis-trans isomerase B (cyclophilin B)
MYKFLIPLFALALLLVGCGEPTIGDTTDTGVKGYSGKILEGKHVVVLKTSEGDITVELDADAAPKTVTNFIALANAGYYNGLTFHRVIPDFMIQGGDPNGDGTGGESIFGETFEDEISAESYDLHKKKLKDIVGDQPLPTNLEDSTVKEYYELQGYRYNDSLESLPLDRGYLAMANRGPNTNGSQFFIITKSDGTPWLDGKHTVFGQVTDGMDVVDAITNVERGANDLPITPVTFEVEVE